MANALSAEASAARVEATIRKLEIRWREQLSRIEQAGDPRLALLPER